MSEYAAFDAPLEGQGTIDVPEQAGAYDDPGSEGAVLEEYPIEAEGDEPSSGAWEASYNSYGPLAAIDADGVWGAINAQQSYVDDLTTQLGFTSTGIPTWQTALAGVSGDYGVQTMSGVLLDPYAFTFSPGLALGPYSSQLFTDGWLTAPNVGIYAPEVGSGGGGQYLNNSEYYYGNQV